MKLLQRCLGLIKCPNILTKVIAAPKGDAFAELPQGFDRDLYLKLNPDVKNAGFDAETHYLLHGRQEGRIYRSDQAVAERDGQISSLTQAVAERDGQISSLTQAVAERDGQIVKLVQKIELPDDFDRDGYLKLNPDLAESGVDPEAHYLAHGRHEGRSYALPEPDLMTDQSELPDDFDRDVYLKLNPDLAESGVDPEAHYLAHGRYEGRIFSLPEMRLCGTHLFKHERETILVVSHEASRTGAPILSLNIVQALVGRYNVVTLLLGGGSLTDSFQQSGSAVVSFSSNLKENPVMAEMVVPLICERFNFKFALVNSIESRVVLPVLSNHFVPAISLIHEFASCYTRPQEVLNQACFWSGDVVFSANMTWEDALAEYPDLRDRSVHILPQGRCLLPAGDFSEEQLQAEHARIRDLMRPKDIAADTVVVLGAGYVQYRKGVDLFIECAARVVRTPEGRKCRFVWVGKGYDPQNDAGYSVYLADQIRRAGLQGYIFFIDETPAIEAAYEEADLLLLSSRLDPLPNVAIDAMDHGVPVLCFDKTTGIADFLIESGLRNHCVADYLDSADMAKKILSLANSRSRLKNVADQCREASIAYFNMEKYVARLEELARDVGERTQQERADTRTILDSGLFQQDFSNPPLRKLQSLEEQVRFYVRGWASGISRRKPFPNFHPSIYLEQHGVAVQGADPFADYLRAGRPDGAWNTVK